MIIDNKRDFTARRIIKKKTGTTSIFTNHYSVKVMLAGLPERQKSVNKESFGTSISQGAGRLMRN